MIDQRSRILTVEDCEEIAARFAAAAGSYRYRPRLQTALMLGSRLIVTLSPASAPPIADVPRSPARPKPREGK